MLEFGLPLCLTKNVTSPLGTRPETFFEIKSEPEQSEEINVYVQSLFSMIPIAFAFGIPLLELFEGKIGEHSDSGMPPYKQLQQAGQRATN